MKKYIPFLITLLLSVNGQAAIQDVSQSAQQNIQITLYPKMIAMIKETRKISLSSGSNKLVIKEIPSSILIDSFLFQTLSPATPLKVIEYSFQSPHVTREELLDQSLGQTVQILPHKSITTLSSGKLLAIDGDEALVKSMGLILGVKKDQVAFSQLPYNIAFEPIVTLKVNTPQDAEYLFGLGYLAKGFSWDASYTVIINPPSGNIDLNTWINIHNKSGMNIRNGHFRISQNEDEEAPFYEMNEQVSLPDNSTKNVSWFSAESLKPTQSYRIYPKNNIVVNEEGVVIKPAVETWLSVLNDKKQGLGIPLPQGVIKVFSRNLDGSLTFIGENKTTFTPLGKSLSLRLGSTDEIQAEMRQTDYRKLGSKVVESGYRIDIKNTTNTTKEVSVFQNVSGDWIILRETHPHQEEGKHMKWILTMGPQEEVSLRYRLRMNVD